MHHSRGCAHSSDTGKFAAASDSRARRTGRKEVGGGLQAEVWEVGGRRMRVGSEESPAPFATEAHFSALSSKSSACPGREQQRAGRTADHQRAATHTPPAEPVGHTHTTHNPLPRLHRCRHASVISVGAAAESGMPTLSTRCATMRIAGTTGGDAATAGSLPRALGVLSAGAAGSIFRKQFCFVSQVWVHVRYFRRLREVERIVDQPLPPRPATFSLRRP